MLKDLSDHGRMSVRKAYWTSDEAALSIARRFGITPDEVEGLGQWRLFAHEGVPSWASPGKPRTMKRASIMDLFALPPENGSNGSRPASDGSRPASSDDRQVRPVRTEPSEAERALAAAPAPDDGLTDADIVELRETYVEEPGILDSIAEAFELPRERVIRLLKGDERPEAGGPVYRSLDVDALTI